MLRKSKRLRNFNPSVIVKPLNLGDTLWGDQRHERWSGLYGGCSSIPDELLQFLLVRTALLRTNVVLEKNHSFAAICLYNLAPNLAILFSQFHKDLRWLYTFRARNLIITNRSPVQTSWWSTLTEVSGAPRLISPLLPSSNDLLKNLII